MNYFINYDPNTGISINTYRQTNGYANDDVVELVADIVAGRPGCCPLEGAKDALEDGSLWNDKDQEAIEAIHNLIQEHEAAH